MAAAEYARGHKVSIQPFPKELIYFSLAKEFNWLPSQVDNEPAKNIKAMLHILSIYNNIMT